MFHEISNSASPLLAFHDIRHFFVFSLVLLFPSFIIAKLPDDEPVNDAAAERAQQPRQMPDDIASARRTKQHLDCTVK